MSRPIIATIIVIAAWFALALTALASQMAAGAILPDAHGEVAGFRGRSTLGSTRPLSAEHKASTGHDTFCHQMGAPA